MEMLFLMLLIVILLIVGGMVISLRLYRGRLRETGEVRRVRRVPTSTSLPDDRTEEETSHETVPVQNK